MREDLPSLSWLAIMSNTSNPATRVEVPSYTIPILQHGSASLTIRQAQVEKTIRLRRLARGALAVISVTGVVALSLATWLSYQTSKREAAIFASLSASAFAHGYCDRALRLV